MMVVMLLNYCSQKVFFLYFIEQRKRTHVDMLTKNNATASLTNLEVVKKSLKLLLFGSFVTDWLSVFVLHISFHFTFM